MPVLKQAFVAVALLVGLATPPSAAQTSASDFTSAIRYDALRRPTGTIAPDPDGTTGPIHFAATRTTYDGAGRITKVETGELAAWQDETVAPADWGSHTTFTVFNQVDFTYDSANRKLTKKLSSGGTAYALTQYSYDAVGRLECTAVRMRPEAYSSPPASACTIDTTDLTRPDRITRTVYDAAGQVLKVQKAYGVTVANGFPTTLQQDYESFAYDLDGKPVTMTDANGQTASMTYDGHERQVRWNLPEKTLGGTPSAIDYEEYSYDANGNRLSLRKRDTCTITYIYDALNRMTVKDLPSGVVGGVNCGTSSDVYYGYDLRGLQLYARFGSASGLGITNAYDGLGRLTSTTNDMSGMVKTLSYEWDVGGNRTKITHPDSTGSAPRLFTYEYDGLDRVVAIKENGATTIVSDTYDAQGRRSSETRGSVTTSYNYDPVSRLSSLADDLASTANDVTTWFSYNPANQVARRTRSNDLYAFGGYVTLSRAYATNGLNQYTTGGSASFTYDANGNLTSDGTNTFTYDIENRLVTASGPVATTLQYDPLGRLWRVVTAPKTIEFVHDGDAVVSESSATGMQRYVHGNGEDDPLIWYYGSGLATRYSLQANAQGSVVSVADASGAAISINSYDEYGIPATGNYGRFEYSGQMYIGQVGMYYYKARFYSPTLGRFMQTDPIGYKDQNNLYAYVGNDPENGRDPTGKYTCVDHGDYLTCYASPGLDALLMHIYIALADHGLASTSGWPAAQSSAPPLPSGPVGTPPHTGGKGGQTQSGPLDPAHGGTGDANADFDHLTGGTGQADPSGRRPPGSKVGDNGIAVRPGKPGQGPRIDIPANGSQPGQTLHYPPTSPSLLPFVEQPIPTVPEPVLPAVPEPVPPPIPSRDPTS